MLVNGVDISVKDAINLSNTQASFMKRRDNGLLLSDYQIEVLNEYGIDYRNYSNMSSLLFDIEECLNEDDNSELEEISRQLSEMHYYNETNK